MLKKFIVQWFHGWDLVDLTLRYWPTNETTPLTSCPNMIIKLVVQSKYISVGLDKNTSNKTGQSIDLSRGFSRLPLKLMASRHDLINYSLLYSIPYYCPSLLLFENPVLLTPSNSLLTLIPGVLLCDNHSMPRP